MAGGGSLPELVSLSISAWSLKARFALKYNGIKYRTTPYMPLFGEFALRFRLWEWRRKVTVPVMFTPKDGVLTQSYDIAKWADSHTARPEATRLFPAGKEAEISSWNAESDAVLFFGRQALVEDLEADPVLLREQVPPGLRWLGPLGSALVRATVGRLRSKYRAEGSNTSLEQALAVLRKAQTALRAAGPALAAGEPPQRFLVGGAFSYADIAMAVAVQAVKPLGPPFATTSRVALRQFQPYQAEFADLVQWRDAIFTAYFPTDPDRAAKKKGQ